MSSGNGADSRIYHTTDGGSTWTLQFTNSDSAAFYDCIGFFDAKHGVAYSDASGPHSNILRTTDGGAHWVLLAPGSVPDALAKEGAFASSNSCVVTANARTGWIAASEPQARVFRSDDAGASWRVVSSESPLVHGANSGITALSFRDTEHGLATAAVIDNAMVRDTTPHAVAVTSDGGATWTLTHRPDRPGALSGAALVPAAGDGVALIASYSGVFVTTDLGNTWSALDNGRYWAVRAAGRRAWVVGMSGRITRIDF